MYLHVGNLIMNAAAILDLGVDKTGGDGQLLGHNGVDASPIFVGERCEVPRQWPAVDDDGGLHSPRKDRLVDI